MGSAAQQTLRCCQVDHRRSDSASSQSEVFKLLDSGDLEAAAPQQNGTSTGFGKLQQRLPVDQHVVGDTASHISAIRCAEDGIADGMPTAAMPAPAEMAAGPWQQVRPVPYAYLFSTLLMPLQARGLAPDRWGRCRAVMQSGVI